MSDLRRIVPPGRGPDRWLPASVAIVAVFLFLAIAKPWGRDGAKPIPFPSATARPSDGGVDRTRSPSRHRYDPALFGQQVPDPAWQLWPAGYVVDFGLAGPVTIADPAAPSASPDAPAPSSAAPSPTPLAASPFGSGRPIGLGGSDNLVVLGLNNPADLAVTAMRLWRYDGAVIRRVPIALLPSPWPTPYFHVIGLPSNDSSDDLGPWLSGVYRLDLLTEPGAAIRSIVLVIDPPGGSVASGGLKSPAPSARPTARRPLPDPTAAPGVLSLFQPDGMFVESPATEAAEAEPSCSLAALWRGETAEPGSRCAPIPVSGLVAIAADIGAGAIQSVDLLELDPSNATVPLDVAVPGRAGGVFVTRADGRPFDDGFYELTVVAGGGRTWHWYLDVIGLPVLSGG